MRISKNDASQDVSPYNGKRFKHHQQQKKMLLVYITELGSSDLIAVPGVDLSTQSSFSSIAFLFIFIFFHLRLMVVTCSSSELAAGGLSHRWSNGSLLQLLPQKSSCAQDVQDEQKLHCLA